MSGVCAECGVAPINDTIYHKNHCSKWTAGGENLRKLVQLQGIKHDAGKPPISLVPSQAVTDIAKVLQFGAQKYDAHNWRKGIQYSRVLDAAFRHLLAFSNHEDTDPESGLPHLAHAGCCIAFLLEYQSMPLEYGKFDDRYDPLKEIRSKE